MNKRLINMLRKHHSIHIAMLDAYCQKIHEDISCTILTNIDTANNHFIMEPAILTKKRNELGKRLRKNYESGKVTMQRKYMQKIEPRNDGLSNTLTSVEKDNLVIEPTKEIAAMRGREPVVLGWTRDSKGNIVNRHPVDIANTITSAKRDNTQNYVAIPSNTKDGYVECKIGGVIDISYPTSKTRRGRVQDGGNTTPALTCATENNLVRIENNYRIRKLTERECFRLMGVADTDSDKIRKVVSKSQCYKLAGNSIVVDVLVAIFNQLFSEDKTTDKQLKLF